MKTINTSILSKFTNCSAQIPPVYHDHKQLLKCRNDYAASLKNLLEICHRDQFTVNSSFDLTDEVIPCYLPYQGLNDRDLQEIYGKIVTKIASTKYPQWSIKKDLPELKANEKIRIGFVSGFFHDHSIWKTSLKGWINNLDGNQFELFGYYTKNKNDAVTDSARRKFVKFVQGSLETEQWCQIINNDKLHILIFSGLGMEPQTLNLGALRLAPIQIAATG
ncbi:MAG: glycosyl transferase family 2, partial [Xenococcus sp. (in: cyanobacteria)]